MANSSIDQSTAAADNPIGSGCGCQSGSCDCQVQCQNCGAIINPSQYSLMEDGKGPYCSVACMNDAMGVVP